MARLFVCGDICNAVPYVNNNFISDDVSRIIKSVDYSVCNLEGIESDSELLDYPHQRYGTIKYLKERGFSLCLLANNHITDGGKQRLKYTIELLKQVEMDYIGAGFSEEQVYSAVIKDIGEYKFGFINLCEAQVGQYTDKSCEFGYAWIGHMSVIKTILSIRDKVDYIVCFCHYGLEHFNVPLRCVRDFYYDLLDLGVDCIIGSHPHIAQGYEYHNGKLIIYSLGNFFFPRKPGIFEEENHSYSVLLDFKKNDRIGITPIFHVLENEEIKIDNSGKIDLLYLNSLLGDKYDQYEAITINMAFNGVVGNLLYRSMCSMSDPRSSYKERIKNLLRFSIFKYRYIDSTSQLRKETIVRLFENEIYRYIITKFLK